MALAGAFMKSSCRKMFRPAQNFRFAGPKQTRAGGKVGSPAGKMGRPGTTSMNPGGFMGRAGRKSTHPAKK